MLESLKMTFKASISQTKYLNNNNNDNNDDDDDDDDNDDDDDLYFNFRENVGVLKNLS